MGKQPHTSNSKTTANNTASPPNQKHGIYKKTARSRVTNGKEILPNIDGRSLWARRFRDLIALLESDKGGADAISESERALIRRSATLIVACEHREMTFVQAGQVSNEDLYYFQMASNALRRLLSTLGLERRAKDVQTLDQYLEDYNRRKQGKDAGDAPEDVEAAE